MPASESIFQAGHYLQQMQVYWWPFCRILALFSMAPIFSHKAVPKQVRILLALAVTLALATALPHMESIDPLSAKGLLTALEQIAIGILLGVALQLVFTVFTLVGDVVSTQLGLSMAVFNDPINGVSSSSIMFQLYFVLLVFLFFAIDGHLLAVSVLYQSFMFWPVGSGLHYDGFETVIYALSWVLAAAVLITLPLVFCMVLVQFCFGLLNRVSPTLNLFSLGFSMSILVGLLCIYLTLPNLPDSYLHLSRELLNNIGQLLRGGARV